MNGTSTSAGTMHKWRGSRHGADGLTDRQRHVLRCVVALIRRHGRPPTFREIGAESNLGTSRTDVVAYHVSALQRAGFVKYQTRHDGGPAGRHARNILVVGLRVSVDVDQGEDGRRLVAAIGETGGAS